MPTRRDTSGDDRILPVPGWALPILLKLVDPRRLPARMRQLGKLTLFLLVVWARTVQKLPDARERRIEHRRHHNEHARSLAARSAAARAANAPTKPSSAAEGFAEPVVDD